jgi:hypothetical protein
MSYDSIYPPQFSSTDTYANRYDLDEIDVFLEGDSSNPMFFNVSGLPQALSYGKHYFNLSLLDSTHQPYRLKKNSRILFEFKSSNNVVLRSEITDLEQKNGVSVCFVEVLTDPFRTRLEIEDGDGTLTIVGTLENNGMGGAVIPERFQNTTNYRCVIPIEIRKNLINADSPRVLQSEHNLETALGRFSFAKASVSTKANSISGIQYAGDGSALTSVGGGAAAPAGGS